MIISKRLSKLQNKDNLYDTNNQFDISSISKGYQMSTGSQKWLDLTAMQQAYDIKSNKIISWK